MKKVVSLLVCVIMLISMIPAVGAAGDILGYGSFETRPDAYNITIRSAEYSDELAHTGNVSLKIIGDPKYGTGYLTFKNVVLENHKKYYISMWVYSEAGVTNIVPVAIYRINGERKEVAIDRGSCSSGKWIKFEANFEINDPAEGTLTNTEIRFEMIGVHNLYVDDVELYEGNKKIEKYVFDDSEREPIEIKGETQNLYVDKNAKAGGDGSKEKPFKSIYEARDFIRTINKNMKNNIAVNVMGGFYEMTETFRLTEEDSGTNGYYIIYRAADGEDVILSGGTKKTDWVESEIPGVYKTHHVGDTMRNLYVNDQVAKRARIDEYIVPLSWYDDPDDATCDRDGVIIPKGLIKNPEAATNLEIFKCINYKANWAVKGKAIETEEGTIISFRQPQFYWHQRAAYLFLSWDLTDDFRLENALEFLDEPGEWFQDIDTDTLYYMPKEGENIHESEIIAPVLENMIDVRGQNVDVKAKNIVFTGFTMAHGGNDYTSELGRQTHQSTSLHTYEQMYHYGSGYQVENGNLTFENVENILFKKNIVKNMGAVGINMHQGIVNCEIDGNAFYNIASAATTVGTPRHNIIINKEAVPRNVTFSNNIITKVAHEYPTSGALQMYHINGAYVLHNECYDTGYSGLCVGWGWVEPNLPQRRFNIIGNRVWNTNTLGKDGSAIYTLGTAPGSTLQYNYVSAVPGGEHWMNIYHDNGSSYFYDYRNVVNPGEPTYSIYNWVSTYRTEQTGIVLEENYTAHDKRSYVAADTVETKTEFCADASWSEAARYAISQSGLSDGYEYLYGIVPNWTEQYEIKNVTLQTKEQDNANPVQLKSGKSVNLRAMYERLNGEIYFSEEFTSVRSSDESIVKCDGTKLTAVGSGVANVYATTPDGYELLISVTVNDEVEGVKIYITQEKFAVGDVTHLKYNVDTKFWDYAHLPHEYVSSNPHIVSINDSGELRALRNGHSVITLKVTFDGKVYEDKIEIAVGGSSSDAKLSLNKYVYEIGEDTKVDVSMVKGGSKSKPAGDVSATYENIAKEPLAESVATTYTTAMKYLVSKEIIGDSWNPADTLSEEDFTVMVERATGRTRESMNITIQDGKITRERMAYILVQAIKATWANTMAGPTRMNHISDRNEISPELMPYVSSAIKHELFYIRDSVKEFNPKGIATMEQAAATLYRMLEPSLIRNADFHPHEFNKAFWSEQTSRNAHSVWRNDSNKVIVDSASSMGTGGIELPKETGDYQVVLKSMQNGQIIEGTDYAFVYDKNDILKSDEYTTTFIGDGASGMFLNNNGKIRMITESGNVWNNKDSCAYAYKSYGNGDFEIVTTIEGLANTDADAAAGVMVRASNDPSDVKIDYRIKPGGDTFLCWRDAKGNITSFSQNAKLSFPATIKLVRRGDVFTAYYKDGTEWVANGTSPAIPAIGGNVVAGLMLYTRSDRSGKPSATTFKDTVVGATTGNATAETEEIKPAEKPQEVPEETPEVKFTINRGEHLDIFTNGGFERGVAGWSVVNGNVVKADAAYKGKGSLAFQPTSSSGMATYSLPEMNKKKTYYLIFRAKTKEGTASLSPYIQYHNGSGYVRSNMNFITDMTVTSDEWKEYVIEITFNDAVSSPLLVMSINSTKDVYFDCMELLHK